MEGKAEPGHGITRAESDPREERLIVTAQERRRGVDGKRGWSQYRKRE